MDVTANQSMIEQHEASQACLQQYEDMTGALHHHMIEARVLISSLQSRVRKAEERTLQATMESDQLKAEMLVLRQQGVQKDELIASTGEMMQNLKAVLQTEQQESRRLQMLLSKANEENDMLNLTKHVLEVQLRREVASAEGSCWPDTISHCEGSYEEELVASEAISGDRSSLLMDVLQDMLLEARDDRSKTEASADMSLSIPHQLKAGQGTAAVRGENVKNARAECAVESGKIEVVGADAQHTESDSDSSTNTSTSSHLGQQHKIQFRYVEYRS
jgi:hypothetical protein